MKSIDFLDVLPLPEFKGVPLAATATRALELWSDLMAGVSERASLRNRERIDLLDECIDLVMPSEHHCAGFEFLGITVAQFRAELRVAQLADGELKRWEAGFRSERFNTLRAAARARIRRLPAGCLLKRVALPTAKAASQGSAEALLSACTSALVAGIPGASLDCRNPFAVQVVETRGCPGRSLPTMGKRIPGAQIGNWDRFVRWEDQRLQPQSTLKSVEYREFQVLLPNLEVSYFSSHFPARNLFAHLRLTRFTDSEDRRVLLLDEVQSDWARDWRQQCLGRALPRRRILYGKRTFPRHLGVPRCPFEENWLELVMEVVAGLAQLFGAKIIAWVPGRVQAEINPGLPLSAAVRLYDQRLPRALLRQLGEGGCSEATIAYPTYSWNDLLRYCRGQGWFLAGSDGETPDADSASRRRNILQFHRILGQPAVEHLPAVALTSPRTRVGANAFAVADR